MWIILLTLFVRLAFCWRWNLLCSAVALFATHKICAHFYAAHVPCVDGKMVCRKCQFAGPMLPSWLEMENSRLKCHLPLKLLPLEWRQIRGKSSFHSERVQSWSKKKTPSHSSAQLLNSAATIESGARGTNFQAAQHQFKWRVRAEKGAAIDQCHRIICLILLFMESKWATECGTHFVLVRNSQQTYTITKLSLRDILRENYSRHFVSVRQFRSHSKYGGWLSHTLFSLIDNTRPRQKNAPTHFVIGLQILCCPKTAAYLKCGI